MAHRHASSGEVHGFALQLTALAKDWPRVVACVQNAPARCDWWLCAQYKAYKAALKDDHAAKGPGKRAGGLEASRACANAAVATCPDGVSTMNSVHQSEREFTRRNAQTANANRGTAKMHAYYQPRPHTAGGRLPPLPPDGAPAR